MKKIGMIIAAVLIFGLFLFVESGGAKSLSEKIPVRFANIQLIVNDQVVQTKAEPFIYNGNVYAPVATVANLLGVKQEWDGKTPAVRFSTGAFVADSIVNEASRMEPKRQDYSHPRVRAPRVELVTHNYINLTGESDREFLVHFIYETAEGIPYDSYLTLFRAEGKEIKAVSTIHLFEGISSTENVVFWNETAKEVYVYQYAFLLIETPHASSFGKGELLYAAVVSYQDGKLVKEGELKTDRN